MNLHRIDQERSRRLYARRARTYDFWHHLQTLWADTAHRRTVVQTARLRPNSTCLDVGCGTGLTILEIVRSCPSTRVVGVDTSKEMLLVAKKRFENSRYRHRITIVEADAEHLPFHDCVFDYVISTYGIGGVANQEPAMAEIVRVLKPGGSICFAEMTSPPKSTRVLLRWLHEHIVEPWIKYFWEFRDTDLLSLFAQQELRIISSNYIGHRILGSTVVVLAVKQGGHRY